MARCNFCGAETSLYDNGRPICLQCSDKLHEEHMKRERQTMVQLHPPREPDNPAEA
jgi:hypothetical protein